jgi:branched-chain amino acid transport system ATP-binding protein
VEQYVERALAFSDEAVILRRGHLAWQGRAAEAGAELVAGYLGGDAP